MRTRSIPACGVLVQKDSQVYRSLGETLTCEVKVHSPRCRTVDHVLHRFRVVLAEVDDTGLRLSERIAACAVKEAGSRTDDGSVDGP
jgi:hypothetical protein